MNATFDIQGHRGARGLAPENTLAGFARALGIGVSTIELDVAMTADDVVVVSHDPRLNPDLTRDGAGAWIESGPIIRETPLEALRAYDVGRLKPGTRYARQYPDQEPADGERIPTLAETFAFIAAAGNTAVRFYIEIKIDPRCPALTASPEQLTDATVEVVRGAGAARRVVIQSFDWRVVARVHQGAPDIETACLTAEQPWQDNIGRAQPGATPWTNGLDIADYDGSIPRLVAAAGAGAWSPFYREIDADAVAEAHALGLRVVAWTVNEPPDIRRTIESGVDGVISDYPDRVRAVAGELGRTLPRPAPASG